MPLLEELNLCTWIIMQGQPNSQLEGFAEGQLAHAQFPQCLSQQGSRNEMTCRAEHLSQDANFLH